MIWVSVGYRRSSTVFVGIAMFAAIGFVTAKAQGPKPATAAWADGPEKPTPFVIGARGCATCHVARNRGEDTKGERANWICEMDQFSTFDTQDKHKLAYKAITAARGKRMIELLKFDQAQVQTKCVSCHGMPERGAQTQQFSPESDGVTCVACHGAFKEWVLYHQIPDTRWNALTRGEKAKRFGMTDVWGPEGRAQACASCHIGNHSEQKVLTHAMYAAGHPPLPSFEPAWFSNAEPRHWQYAREKTPERRARMKPAAHAKNLEETQLVVIGGLVGLRQTMQLLADEATTHNDKPAESSWPDFARYDCAACHHELRRDDGGSWRQLRRRGTVPGRPTVADWPLVLARLGAPGTERGQSPSAASEVDGVLGTFRERLRLKPFGDANTVVPSARSVAQWADASIKKLENSTFDTGHARALLEQLCRIAGDSPPDYDSARQIAWAFRIIYHEMLEGKPPNVLIEQELLTLATDCDLDLAPTRKQVFTDTLLEARLANRSNFDPTSFQRHFARIAEQIARIPAARTAGR